MGIWIVPIGGETPHKLQEDAWGAALSPNRTQMVFRSASGTEIRLTTPQARSGETRLLRKAPQGYYFAESLAWSAEGRRIAYLKQSQAGDYAAVENYDLDTGRTVTILADSNIRDFSWAPDGRLVYVRLEDPPLETSSNLWQVSVDPRTSRARGQPIRLTNWAGFRFEYPSLSADARRLAFSRVRTQSDVFVGLLENDGWRMTSPQRLTADEWVDSPAGWTLDSRTILLHSDRTGDLGIFEQGLGMGEAQAIVTGTGEKREPQMNADGRWILYLGWPKDGGRIQAKEGRLFRIPVSGGQPEVVFRVAGYPGPPRQAVNDKRIAQKAVGHPRFRCPSVAGRLCVLSELLGDQLIFTSFDPLAGRKSELLRIDVDDPSLLTFWDLAPDGRTIAFGRREEKGGTVRLLSLVGETARAVSIGAWTHLEYISWAADGKGLFLTAWTSRGVPLLRASLEGKAQLLYKAAWFAENPIPSPDGRYLAFREVTSESNAWLFEISGESIRQ